MDDDFGSGLLCHLCVPHDMVHMRMGVDDILDLIQSMRARFCEKPLGIIRGIDEQSFLTLLIPDQITENPKVSHLILFDNHLLPPNPSRPFQTILYELPNFNFLFDKSPLCQLVEEKKERHGVEKVSGSSIG
jgi:hypothetical protein